MGRPTKITSEYVRQIIELASVGYSRREIAKRIGVGKTSISRWYERGAEMEEGLHRIVYEALQAAEARVTPSGEPAPPRRGRPVDYGNLMMNLLARRFPREYAERRYAPHSEEAREKKQIELSQLRRDLVKRLELLEESPEEKFGPSGQQIETVQPA